MNVGFKAVIPARFASSRLPGKPLLDIAGKPMIAHVCAQAQAAGAEQVVVATDDERIRDAVTGLGVHAVMTLPGHASGTERIAETADLLGWPDATVIVNVQGDEPLLPPEYIRLTASALAEGDAAAATLAAPISDTGEIFNPNAVKVVTDRHGYALYFSRAPIPWYRDGFNQPQPVAPEQAGYLRHIGVYAYTAGFLRRYRQLPVSPLEQVEALEQLRILWAGEKIRVATVAAAPEAGVDTAEDLARVRAKLTAV